MKGRVYILLICFLAITSVRSATKEEWKARTIYQVLTDRFSRTNGDISTPCNLSNYCGGSFKGIENNLDYIKNLGFDAIWISPVIDNIDGGYHGYWSRDLYKTNSNFGTADELKSLVNACHAKGIWVMVDVVGNHTGPTGQDYSGLNPFNKPEHYHDYCIINQDDFSQNQFRVEVRIFLS